jgi:hypothetical protein
MFTLGTLDLKQQQKLSFRPPVVSGCFYGSENQQRL